MKAVVCERTELSVRDLPDPEPGPGQVLLEVVRAGICGSDLHARFHADELAEVSAQVGMTDIMRSTDAVVMGHEFSGRVAAYGPDTRRRYAEGTPVVAFPMVRREGAMQMIGLSPKATGAYAERVVVEESFLFDVDNGYSPEKAAMTEPMAVAWHAVRKSRIGKGETAVVVGCGPIGLAVILMLKARGVRHVVASDYSAARRALAERCGADEVVDPAATSPWSTFEGHKRYRTDATPLLDYAHKAIGDLRRVPFLPWTRLVRAAETLGQSPQQGPVVFECVGVPGILDHVIASAPLYSRVVVVGVCMEPDTITPVMAINKELSLQFVFAYDPAEYADTLRMLTSGAVDPTPLHTGTVGLGEVAQAFEDLGSAEHHAKVLVDPSA
jgi:threonine dehydrogenase-like Zn-dependent dehydrogenase